MNHTRSLLAATLLAAALLHHCAAALLAADWPCFRGVDGLAAFDLQGKQLWDLDRDTAFRSYPTLAGDQLERDTVIAMKARPACLAIPQRVKSIREVAANSEEIES